MGMDIGVSFEMLNDIGVHVTLPNVCPGYRAGGIAHPGYRSGEGQVIMRGALR